MCLTIVPLSMFNTLAEDKENIFGEFERQYFEKLKFLKRKETFLCGRYAAKQSILKIDDTIKPPSADIVYGLFNNPIIRHSYLNFGVSITHNSEAAIAVVFPDIFSVGIDIESISSCKPDIIDKQLSNDEKRIIKEKFSNTNSGGTVFWTIKEAVSKIMGGGLLISFNILEIESIEEISGNIFESAFKHFPHLRGISIRVNNSIFSMVFPKQFLCDLLFSDMIKYLKSILQ